MPQPTNKEKLNLDSLKEPKPNVYAVNTSGKRYHMVVPMLQMTEDGKQLHLPMVVLTPREENDIEATAYQLTRAAFKEVPKNDEPGLTTWVRMMDNHRGVLTVLHATRLPDDLSQKFFMDKQQIEDTYTLDEIGILCNHYLTVKLNQAHLKHFNPNEPGALQALIDVIKRDGESDFFLNGLTTHSVNQLVKSLVVQLASLQKDSGSLGMLSDSGKPTA